MQYVKSLLLLVLIVVLYGESKAQTEIFYTSFTGTALELEPVNVCQDSNFVNQARIEITDTVVHLVVEVVLPDGLDYVPGSVKLISSSRSNGLSVTYDGFSGGAHSFSIDQDTLFSFDNFIIEWARKANCLAIEGQQAGDFFKDDVHLTWDGGSNSETNEAVRSYDLLVAAISIAGQGPIVTTLGSTVDRTITITNGGQGDLDNFIFYIVDGIGTSTNSLETVGGTVITPSSNNGDTLFYSLSTLEIQEFGNNNNNFENGEQVVLKRTYTVTECTNYSGYGSFWGCEGSVCQATTTLSQSTVIDNLIPNVDVTQIDLDEDYCFKGQNTSPAGQAVVQTFKMKNSGNGEARNLFLKLNTFKPGSNTGYNYFETSENWVIKDDAGQIIGSATHDLTISTANRLLSDCSKIAKATSVRYALNNIVIPAGDSITVEVPTYVNNMDCITGCPSSISSWYSFSGGWEYKDQCESNNYGVTLKRFFSKAVQIQDYLVEMPTDLIDQQEFTANIDFSRLYTRVKSGVEGYNDFIIDLTSTSLMYNGGPSISTPFGIVPVTVSGDSITIRLPANLSNQSGVMPISLKADCAGQPGGAQTIEFSNAVSYNGVESCSFNRVECLNNTFQMHCPSPCPRGGATPKFFTLERVNLGLQDDNDNGVADSEMTASRDTVNLHRAVNGDTIQGTWNIYVNPNVFDAVDNPSDPNSGTPFNFTYIEFDLRKYSLANCTNDNDPDFITLFTALPNAEVTVFPSGGGPPTTCTVTATLHDDPGTTQVLNTIAKYDLLPCKATWEGGDSIVVEAKFIANASINNTGFDLYIADNEVYSSYVANPTGNNPSDENKYTCDHFNDYMNVLRIWNSPYMPNPQDIDGCTNNFQAYLRQYVNVQANNVWFPNEYRNFTIQDRFIVDWPSELEFRLGSATYMGLPLSDANVMQTSNQLIFSNLSQFFTPNGGTVDPGDETQSRLVEWSVDPSCDAEIGVIYRAQFYGENYGDGVNYPSTNVKAYRSCDNEYSANIDMQYDGPLPFISGGATEQVSSNNVTWNFFLNNGSNSIKASNTWFYIQDLNGSLDNFVVKQGASILSPDSNGFFVIGDNNAGASTPYSICGELIQCKEGEILLLSGFDCTTLPSDINAITCSDTLMLASTNLPSEVQVSFITQPPVPMDLCEDQPVKLRQTSAQAAYLDDPILRYTVPAGVIMPAMINVEYPEGSGNIESLTPVVMGSQFSLNLEDHSQISADGLPGTIDALTPQDRSAVIDFMFSTDCSFLSGDNFIFTGLGNRPCGDPAINNGVRVRTVDLDIEGIVSPYANNFTLNSPTINGCERTTLSADIEFVSLSTSMVSEMDSVYITLQDDLQYVDGSFNCPLMTAECLVYNRTYSDINGDQVIVLQIPSGGMDISSPMTTSFTYDVIAGNDDVCGDTKLIDYKVVSMLVNIPCSTESTGSCPSLSVTIDEESVEVKIKKRIVTFESATTYCNNSGSATYSGLITIDSIALDVSSSIILDVYCADGSGNPASYTESITFNGPIAIGTTLPFSGALSNTCNPLNGVVIQMSKISNDSSEQCTCDDQSLFIEGTSMLACSIVNNNNVQCFGESNGSATVSGTGGTAPFTYLWDNGDMRSTADTLSVGTHNVTVTDTYNCTSTCSVTISEPVNFLCTATLVNNVACNGESNGIATVSASGGTPNYTYAWDNGETGAVAFMLDAGSHSVVVTDNNNCTSSCSVLVTESTMLTCTVSLINNVLCNGQSNGSAMVTAAGGNGSNTYSWDNGETTSTATMLDEGLHMVTVTDANNCTTTCSITITEPMPLLCTVVETTPVECDGESNGVGTVSTSGGTGMITFSWDNGETTAIATTLDAGIHSVTVTDANFCSSICTVSITEPTILACTASELTPVICNGERNGVATVIPTGGNGTTTYLWDNGDMRSTADTLSAGAHTVTVTDVNNCTSTCMVTITEPLELACTTTLLTNVSCNGESNGSASVTPTGGTPNYTYAWDNGESTGTATTLDAGTHTVTITDGNNCSTTCSVLVTESTMLTCTVSLINNVLCNGQSNGSAMVTAAGGNGSNTYSWDNGETTSTATMLDEGLHMVTVTDANNCTTTCSITITEPMPLLCTVVETTPVECNGESNGEGTVSTSGGTGMITYAWDNGETTAIATTLDAGVHSVTVTDANSCSSICTVSITEPTILACTASELTPVICNGERNGVATVIPTGGNGTNTYLWDNGDMRSTADTLSAGAHTVTVTDVNNCTSTCMVTITEPLELACTTTLLTNVSCNGESNGSASVTPTGGTPNYTYAWDNGESTGTATTLDAGTHTVTITDGNNCSTTCSVLVTESTMLTCTVSLINNVLCNGQSNGSAMVTAAGGNGSNTYSWDNGETTSTATMLDEGLHMVTVTDANNCTTTCSITITEPMPLLCTVVETTPVECNGESNGVGTVRTSGGTGMITYGWDNGEKTAIATTLDAGIHSVTITDANSCSSICTVSITEPTILACTASELTPVICNGERNGVATVIPTGGNGTNTYLWDNGDMRSTTDTLSAGPHTVTVTDVNNCTSTCMVTITEPLELACTTTLLTNVSCNGESNGSASVTPTGGTPNYTYAWDNGESTGTATTLDAGTHTVTITDGNNCRTTCSIRINEFDQLSCTVVEDSPVECYGESNGAATISPVGGSGGNTYIWDNGETTMTATTLNVGLHTVTVTDNNNCTTTCTVIINEPELLTCSIVKNSDPECSGSNGSATVNVNGGNGNLTYAWSNGESTGTATMLSGGTAMVTITDDKNCMTTCSVEMVDRVDCISIDKMYISAIQTSAYCYDVSYNILVENYGVVNLEYDLNDTTAFDNDVLINSAVYSSDASDFFPLSLDDSGEWTIANNQEIVVGKKDSYTITINVCVDLSDGIVGDDIYSACESSNGVLLPNKGLLNTVSIDLDNDGIPNDQASDCGDLPYITHEKESPSISTQNADLSYDVIYLVIVKNEGGAEGAYDLKDIPNFDDDVKINFGTFVSTNGLNGILSTSNGMTNILADDQIIDSETLDTFTLVFNVTLDLSTASTDGGNNVYDMCDSSDGIPDAGGGLYNRSTLDLDNDGESDEISEVCGDLPYITHIKTGPIISFQNADQSYDVTYTIEVENIGGATGVYDLFDTPRFDDDIVINSASFIGDNGLSGGLSLINETSNILADDQLLKAEAIDVYTIVFNVSMNLNPSSLDNGDNRYVACGEGDVGQSGHTQEALLNISTLDTNNDGISEETSSACGDLPFIVLEKSDPIVSNRNTNGTYDVIYEISVSNIGGANGIYDLFDTPQFDNDITINSASFVSSNSLFGDLQTANDTENQLANDVVLGALNTDTYTVAFNVTLDLSGTNTDLGDNRYNSCGVAVNGNTPSSFEGLYNTAMIDTNNDGSPEQEDDACGDIFIFDLAAKKTVDPGQNIVYGGEVFYTITVYNQGNINAQNIEVIDYLPSGVSFAPSNDVAVWTYNEADSTAIGFVSEVILPGDSIEISLIGIVGEGPDWTNTIEIFSSEDDMNNDTSNDDIDSTPNDDQEDDNGDETTDNQIDNDGTTDEDDQDPATFDVFDLALRKTSVTAEPVNIGDVVVFEFKIFNQGNIPAFSIDVTDFIATGFRYEQNLNPLWMTTGSTATSIIDGPLAEGDSTAVLLRLIVTDDGTPSPEDWYNEGEISSADDDENPDNEPPTDFDSTPDTNPDNDNDVTPGDDNDDVTDEYGEFGNLGDDEDDNDVSLIIVNGAIGNYVWNDTNANGVQDSEELGIEGVIVNVLDINGNIIGTDTTDVNGYYYIDNLPPGNYQIQFFTDDLLTQYNPSPNDEGGNDTTDSDADSDGFTIFTEIVSGEIDTTWDAGFYEPAAIGNYVWIDSNADGFQDASEDGVEGVIVNVLDLQGNIIGADTTDVNGEYYIGNLIPGNYQLQFIPTVDLDLEYAPSPQDVSGDAVDSDINVDGFTVFTTLEPGEYDDTWDAGYAPLFVNIGDYVWHDIDGDGIQDSTEPGIDGVVVNLYNENYDFISTTTTDELGNYLFEDVFPDTYFIVFEDPEGFTSTFPNTTNNNNDSDITNSIINAGGSTTDLFVVYPGEDDLSIDAGYYMCIPIGELVWYDVNENDIWDVVENGINGLEVNLYRLVGGSYELYETQLTGHKPGTPSDDGYFKFCAPPGTYYVEVVMPSIGLVQTVANAVNNLPITNSNEPTNDSDLTNHNGRSTTASFTVLSGDVICNLGAGYYPMASLGNLVWNDTNNNGRQDASEERVGGVVVEAFETNGSKVAESTTDSEGVYAIDYLGKNDYYLKFTPPAGYGFTTPDMGGENTDSDVTHAYGNYTTNTISLIPGMDNISIDAGLAFGAVLPVEWVSVDAKWLEDYTKVAWSTGSEINCERYEVERRHESETRFIKVGEVEAKGTSSVQTDYTFNDRGDFKNGFYHYRIKQLDYEGLFDYSATVRVEVLGGSDNNISLYPNPSHGETYLTIDLPEANSVQVNIYDAAGKLFRTLPLLQDDNGVDTELQISNIPAGVYTLSIEADNFKEVKRLIVVR